MSDDPTEHAFQAACTQYPARSTARSTRRALAVFYHVALRTVNGRQRHRKPPATSAAVVGRAFPHGKSAGKGRGFPRPAGLACLVLLAAPPPHAAMAADDVQRRALRQRCEVVQVVFCWFKPVLVVVAVQRDANALRPAAGKYILRRRVGVEKPQCRLASLFLNRQRGYICAHVREQRHPEGHTCPTLARHMQGPVLLFFSHAHWHIDHPFQMYQPCASLYL